MIEPKQINDKVNKVKPMGPQSKETEKQQASAASSLLYSDNIVAVCAAVNSEVPQNRVLTEEERHERRLESNRLSARRRRQRHATQVKDLQEQVRSLSNENEELKAEHDRLQELVRQHEETIVTDNAANFDTATWEQKTADEKEDEHQRYQELIIEGELISASVQDPTSRSLPEQQLDGLNSNENKSYIASYQTLNQEEVAVGRYIDINEAQLTTNQSSEWNPSFAFSSEPERVHFHANDQLNNESYDGGEECTSKNSYLVLQEGQTHLNADVPTPGERETSESISLPGDVSKYFDMLFHTDQPEGAVVDSNGAAPHLQDAKHHDSFCQNFESVDNVQNSSSSPVPRVHDCQTNSADNSSLSSCPVVFPNSLPNEENWGEIGSVTEEIFDQK
jgi:hypothetical protein